MSYFIKTYDLSRFNFAFFDYMGFETGNKYSKPLDDIKMFLTKSREMIIVIGATFCARSCYKRSKGYFSLEDKIEYDFNTIFEQTKFNVIDQVLPLRYVKNKVPMIFFVYILSRTR
jgi:hypothetical protein